MAVQTLHGLVRGAWSQDLIGRPVQGSDEHSEIDALIDQIAHIRTRLRVARDINEVGELLALIYRCEDRIKDIKRSSRRQKSPAKAQASRM